MEFNFNIEKVIGNVDKDGFGFLDGKDSNKYSKRDFGHINTLLDEIGTLSATSQELKTIITTGIKFFGSDQKIYMKCEGNAFIGFIKVGKRQLFLYDEAGTLKQVNPLCVLDFYVYEGCQRSGFGKEIFTKMLECEGVEPRKLGYDRPSEKLISFLKKHYKLIKYTPQNNNFVVFNDFFLLDGPTYGSYNKSTTNAYSYNGNMTTNQKKTFHSLKKDHEQKSNYDDDYNYNSMEGNYYKKDTQSYQGLKDQKQYNCSIDYGNPYASSSSDYGAFISINNKNTKQNYK